MQTRIVRASASAPGRGGQTRSLLRRGPLVVVLPDRPRRPCPVIVERKTQRQRDRSHSAFADRVDHAVPQHDLEWRRHVGNRQIQEPRELIHHVDFPVRSIAPHRVHIAIVTGKHILRHVPGLRPPRQRTVDTTIRLDLPLPNELRLGERGYHRRADKHEVAPAGDGRRRGIGIVDGPHAGAVCRVELEQLARPD